MTAGSTENIRSLYREGESPGDIAEKLRLDHRRVLHVIAGIKAARTKRRVREKRSNAAHIAHKTRRKEWRKMKRKLLILDCTSASREQKSEGALLSELIDILNAKNGPKVVKRLEAVRDRKDFIDALKEADETFIHISAHGMYDETKRPVICLPSGAVIDPFELESIWEESYFGAPQFVFLSACETGHPDMAEALYNAGCRYFVAPMFDVYWYDAATFLTVFYRLLLVETNKSPWIAFRTASKALKYISPNITNDWCFFDKGLPRFV